MEKLVRLLLIEDNPGDAVLLRSMLLPEDRYQVEIVSRLDDAVSAVSRQSYDVAFVDLSLPDSHGLATVEILRSAAPDLPIVVLTGGTDESVALAAVSSGAQDYLVKGQAQTPMLTRAIRHAIDRKHAEISLRRAHDDLERRVHERTADLLRANRILQMINECNQALVHSTDELVLAGAMCRILHNLGGYPLVRVAYAAGNEAEPLKLVASAGKVPDSAEGGAGDFCECSCAPAAGAVKSGRMRLCPDLLADSEPMSWRAFAAGAGLRSVVAFPLMSEGRPFGALMIFSADKDAFDDSRTGTLRSLAEDMAFGITALRARTQRDRAEQALERRAEQLRALASELTQAEQTERRRLAQVIHDCLQQLLVSAKYTVFLARSKTRSKPVIDAMDQLSQVLDESIAAARSLTSELSPPIFHEKGLAAGLEWLASRMQEKHGLHVEISADPSAEPPSEHLRVFIFEAVRELLFNVVKHAGVHRARLRLFRAGDEVRVEVSDDGAGFDPEQ